MSYELRKKDQKWDNNFEVCESALRLIEGRKRFPDSVIFPNVCYTRGSCQHGLTWMDMEEEEEDEDSFTTVTVLKADGTKYKERIPLPSYPLPLADELDYICAFLSL